MTIRLFPFFRVTGGGFPVFEKHTPGISLIINNLEI